MPHLELHYTEWSSSYTPADPIHDSYQQAAYILQKLKQVGDAVQSMSYWVFTDIFEEAGPRFEAFHGGFGLMNTQGIKKPAYFAYQFLNQLGTQELLNSDQQSFATTDEQGNAQLLLWDFTYTLLEDINNQQYYVRDLPAKGKGDIDIQVKGVKEGNYILSISQVGYRQNDAYASYIDMGSPAQLTKACLPARYAPPAEVLSQLKNLKSPDDINQLDFLPRATLAVAAAWSPNPERPPFYLDLPSPDAADTRAVLSRWAANAPLVMVDQYNFNLRQYRAIAMDVGDQDYLHKDASALRQRMEDLDIAISFQIYKGDHGNAVADRFQNHVLPFFGQNLLFE
jgi:hypothetical protein